MNNEEVIAYLQNELEHVQSHLNDKGKAPVFYEDMRQLCEAYEIAIEALRAKVI